MAKYRGKIQLANPFIYFFACCLPNTLISIQVEVKASQQLSTFKVETEKLKIKIFQTSANVK